MALRFLINHKIESNKKINLSRHTNVYKINTQNLKIKLYKDNPGFKKTELNTWNLPKQAREMDFEIRDDKTGDYIIIPRFYDNKGNLLKIGNR